MRPTALVVDDYPAVADLHSRYLCRLGFDVMTAYDIGQAEALLESAPFSLLVTDLELQHDAQRDGLALIRRARTLWPEIRAILVTGWAETEQVTSASGQAVHVLGKPLSFAVLAKLVADLVHAGETGSSTPGAIR
jgi:two-component system, NtrC family, response regulator PilR